MLISMSDMRRAAVVHQVCRERLERAIGVNSTDGEQASAKGRYATVLMAIRGPEMARCARSRRPIQPARFRPSPLLSFNLGVA